MIEETGRYKIYFRVWPLVYFLAQDTQYHRYVLLKKIFNEDWGNYQWREI